MNLKDVTYSIKNSCVKLASILDDYLRLLHILGLEYNPPLEVCQTVTSFRSEKLYLFRSSEEKFPAVFPPTSTSYTNTTIDIIFSSKYNIYRR